MTNKIYLDCTHTYNSGLNTGIQRVVKNTVKNIPFVSKELDVEIIPVVSISNQYRTFDKFPKIVRKNNDLKLLLKKLYIKIRSVLILILPKKAHTMLLSPSISILLNKIVDKILFAKKITTDRTIILNPNDILILIDTTWLNNNYKQLKQLHDRKVKIVAVIYDIIPIEYPHFCTMDLTLALKDWYIKTVKYIDAYISISHSVKNDIFEYIKNNINNKIEPNKFDYFYLGADVKTFYNLEKVPKEIKKIFTISNTYLTVSTIEPRKNHKYILDVFDTLWKQGKEVKYVIVGRIGWNMSDFIKRIKQHKQYNKRLFLLTDIDDDSLIYAYKNSKALIFASYAEGFGLPIVESLFYQLPVLASSTPIHKEIGGENITYFHLSDSNSLLSIISGKVKVIIPKTNFQWQSWQQSAKALILKCKEI